MEALMDAIAEADPAKSIARARTQPHLREVLFRNVGDNKKARDSKRDRWRTRECGEPTSPARLVFSYPVHHQLAFSMCRLDLPKMRV